LPRPPSRRLIPLKTRAALRAARSPAKGRGRDRPPNPNSCVFNCFLD